MATEKLIIAAKAALKEYLCVTPTENILIISDEGLREIGLALYEAGQTLCKESFYVEIKKREVNGQEPPEAISSLMKKVDAVICATSRSMTHTDARRGATEAGTRVGTMPGINTDIMLRCFAANSNSIIELNNKLISTLTDAKEIKLTSKSGTDATFGFAGRKVISSTGVLSNKSAWGNIPSGEVYFAPLEDKADGKLIIDGSVAGIGMIKEPITIYLKNGKITSIEGGDDAKKLDEMLSNVGEKAKIVAEFGIGTNPKAEISGCILEDEKVMGTVHIAFGNNISMGGTNDIPIHIDCIIRNPSFSVDGKSIMEEGKFVF
ncbi:MAG: aminopeptidase [Bacteroidetes bacterium]|nr:aminopeptidase [Bacteroidota bacterium]